MSLIQRCCELKYSTFFFFFPPGLDKGNAVITLNENLNGKKNPCFKNDYKCMENMYFSGQGNRLFSQIYIVQEPQVLRFRCNLSNVTYFERGWVKAAHPQDWEHSGLSIFHLLKLAFPTFALQILDHDWLIRMYVVPSIVNSMSESVFVLKKKMHFTPLIIF